jgi:hypothetical protein
MTAETIAAIISGLPTSTAIPSSSLHLPNILVILNFQLRLL